MKSTQRGESPPDTVAASVSYIMHSSTTLATHITHITATLGMLSQERAYSQQLDEASSGATQANQTEASALQRVQGEGRASHHLQGPRVPARVPCVMRAGQGADSRTVRPAPCQP